MVRFEFCRDLAEEGFNQFADNRTYQFLNERDLKSADKIVNAYGNLLLDGRVPYDIRGRLLDYMTRGQDNQPTDFKFDGDGIRHKVRGMVQLMASSPLYQLA